MTEFLKTKQEIVAWLDMYDIKRHRIIIPDKKYGFVVNIKGNVDLDNKSLKTIPVKFNQVEGIFNCHDNFLVSLEFCPHTVRGHFDCSNNQLTSLEFGPQKVGGDFHCSDNKLTSLEHCPQFVGEYFDCSNNQLTSLEYCPQFVGAEFLCSQNPLLGDIQKISVFKKIYQYHLEIVNIKKNKELLHTNIQPEMNEDNIKTVYKI